MPDHRGRRRSPARLIAPIALLICAVAFASVVLSSPAVDSDETGGVGRVRGLALSERLDADGRRLELGRPGLRVGRVDREHVRLDLVGEMQRHEEEAGAQTERQAGRRRRNYTVQTGDTLGAIAEKTGVSVERLLVLNPELDPQALVAGQRIRLRE